MQEYSFSLKGSLSGELLLFRTLWNNSSDNMFIVGMDKNGDFIAEACNRSLEKTFNLVPNQMDGLKIKDILDEKTYKIVSDRYSKCIKLNKPISYDESAIINGAEERFYNTTILPVVNEQDGSIGIFGISKEFTKLKNTQKELKLLTQKLEEEVKQRTKELSLALLEMEKLSTIDALTGVFNRRYFDNIFSKMINSAKRKNEFFNFLILDVDHFKEYNDIYGHQAGDKVLKILADTIKKTFFRADDSIFRLGGEEFGVIFNTKNEANAIKQAEKLRLAIYDLKIQHSRNKEYRYMTVSLGLISKNSYMDIKKDDTYRQSDVLLYKAKEKGRNRLEYLTFPLH